MGLMISCNNDDDDGSPPPAPDQRPELSTVQVSNINYTDARSGGEITSDKGFSVTERGVCWSTDVNPTIANDRSIDGQGIGSFVSILTDLAPGTSYFVRAYATSSQGTAYGSAFNFQTLAEDEFRDVRDGSIYKTVSIGDQTWMAENLRYLPIVNSPLLLSTSEAFYYVYGYSGSNLDQAVLNSNYQTYGTLYNWTAAMNGQPQSTSNPSGVQGICPDGWHLPSAAEWEQLSAFLGGPGIAGKLKEAGNEHWTPPNLQATNESGFTGLPGGVLDQNGTFSNLGSEGVWWATRSDAPALAFYFRLRSNGVFEDYSFTFNKSTGACVRCLMD